MMCTSCEPQFYIFKCRRCLEYVTSCCSTIPVLCKPCSLSFDVCGCCERGMGEVGARGQSKEDFLSGFVRSVGEGVSK